MGKIRAFFSKLLSKIPGKRDGRSGRYFSTIQFRFLILPVISLLVGLLVAILARFAINGLAELVGSGFRVNVWIFLALMGIGPILVIRTSGETFSVPNEHIFMLTIFGKRFDIYLEEGDYPDFAPGSILGRSEAVKNGFTTDALHPNGPGFINMGIIPFQIWNDRSKEKNQILENVARNSSTVFATLLLEVKVLNPRAVLNAEDPLLMLAERARTAFRTAISFFIDRDNASVKTILVLLMAGRGIVTSFINDKEGANFNQGAMIKNHGGTALYRKTGEVPKPPIIGIDNDGIPIANESPEAFRYRCEQVFEVWIQSEKKAFRDILKKDADDVMLKSLPKKVNDQGEELIVVEYKSVETSLDEVLDSIGASLHSASVSNIQYSEKVRTEANQASSEHFKDKSMRDSARSQGASEETMANRRKALKEEGLSVDALDRAIVAAQDNPNIKIFHTSGDGSELSKAAAILAGKEKS